MLTHPATKQDIAHWQEEYARYRDRLAPNRRTGAELLAHLRALYPVTEVTDERWRAVIAGNVLENAFSAAKMPAGAAPLCLALRVENTGAGAALYAAQDAPFRGQSIYVGLELHTGEFTVEGGGSLLWDELFAWRGLDAADLDNYFLTAQYVECLARFGLLDTALAPDDAVTMHPIGYIRSPYAEPDDTPPWGSESEAEAVLELDTRFLEGAADIRAGEKYMVIFCFHKASRKVRLTVPVRGVGPLRGVFSTHSPCRPNPIGVSIVTVTAVDGARIRFRGVDMADGTPVLDIKSWRGE